MVRSLALVTLVMLPGLALAQTTPSSNTRTLAEAQASAPNAEKQADASLAASNTPPQKVRSVTVTGDKPCPKSTAEEVVVCHRAGEDERYRIPPKFRELPHPAANNSWTNRAALIDEVSNEAGGLPGTCSVNGTNGQTGCSKKALEQWRAERRAKRRAAESIP